MIFPKTFSASALAHTTVEMPSEYMSPKASYPWTTLDVPSAHKDWRLLVSRCDLPKGHS